MRSFLLAILLMFLGMGGGVKAHAADGTPAPSVALVLYKVDNTGYYHKWTNVPVSTMETSATCYAYDSKAKRLYLSTDYGNFAITLNDEMAKQVKKDKNVPQLSGEELKARINAVNRALDDKFEHINANRRHAIEDSIAAVKERDRLAALERARQDSIREVQRLAQLQRYRAEHDWHWLPLSLSRLSCTMCDEGFYVRDSVRVAAICNDTIYYLKSVQGNLGLDVMQIHAMPVSSSMWEYAPFRYHMEAFDDSISTSQGIDREIAEDFNRENALDYLSQLTKKAPYGYFLEWDWDDTYSMLTFEFTYLNTNKKTIKYIDVYWRILNDVDDVRNTGHFKGTGPLEQYKSARWAWDSSSYFLAGDATRMELTKVIITYMNGSQQTLTKKMIFTETDYHDN